MLTAPQHTKDDDQKTRAQHAKAGQLIRGNIVVAEKVLADSAVDAPKDRSKHAHYNAFCIGLIKLHFAEIPFMFDPDRLLYEIVIVLI